MLRKHMVFSPAGDGSGSGGGSHDASKASDAKSGDPKAGDPSAPKAADPSKPPIAPTPPPVPPAHTDADDEDAEDEGDTDLTAHDDTDAHDTEDGDEMDEHETDSTGPTDPKKGGQPVPAAGGDAATVDGITQFVKDENEELKPLREAGAAGAKKANERKEGLIKIVTVLEKALGLANAALKTGGGIDSKALRDAIGELLTDGRNFHNTIADHHNNPVGKRADEIIAKYAGKSPLDLVS